MASDLIFIFLYILAAADLIILLAFFAQRANRRKDFKKCGPIDEAAMSKLFRGGVDKSTMDAAACLVQDIDLDFAAVNGRRRNLKKVLKSIGSPFRLQRIKAATELSFFADDAARTALEEALKKESSVPVKLFIANALSDIKNKKSIPVITESLIGENRWYREKVDMLLADFGGDFKDYLPVLTARPEMEIREAILDFAEVYIADELKKYVFDHIDQNLSGLRHEDVKAEKKCSCCAYGQNKNNKGTIICRFKGVVSPDYRCRHYSNFNFVQDEETQKILLSKALAVAQKYYFSQLASEQYLSCENADIRRCAVRALSNVCTPSNLEYLKSLLADDEVGDTALNSMAEIVRRNQEYIPLAADWFLQEKDEKLKMQLGRLVNINIEYFAQLIKSADKATAELVFAELIRLNMTEELDSYIYNNADARLIESLQGVIDGLKIADFEAVVSAFEDRSPSQPPAQALHFQRRDKAVIKTALIIAAFAFLAFPVWFFACHAELLQALTVAAGIKMYVLDYNYLIAIYSVVINLIYIVLLLLSWRNSHVQEVLWSCKGIPMLFKRKMLPGVSIIAPAFNEQDIIIDSINSLLSLKYPDFELIVVNDGSTDGTLGKVIEYFSLKRIGTYKVGRLNTAKIKGVYHNPKYPLLKVIDKDNAGKADSLNAGINYSSKEYYCCIDSDSLLEDDALLKLAAASLDHGIETPALGGNVLPSNGCSVERGHIVKKYLPQTAVPMFQTVEYIRAFMAGRLGLSRINCLLIISGAFGLFRKERVVAAGGYLSRSEKFGKDTVGEDMELVVRISRVMREQRRKYRICYAFNANCWTEVPESSRGLRKQRFRWYRGLIEIMSFHRKLLFNPRYGMTGILALPYFLIFEAAGPLIEIQGYVMIVVAAVMGIMNLQLALTLFVAMVMLGVTVSMCSLLIFQKGSVRFRTKDVFKLLFYAVAENFGFRQLLSLFRFFGFFSLFAANQHWGEQVRKGFVRKDIPVQK